MTLTPVIIYVYEHTHELVVCIFWGRYKCMSAIVLNIKKKTRITLKSIKSKVMYIYIERERETERILLQTTL